MSSSTPEWPDYNPGHIHRSRGSKKQSPNGQGQRARRPAYSWRAVVPIAPAGDHPDLIKDWDEFRFGVRVPRLTTIHSISDIQTGNAGEPYQQWVDVDMTVHSSCTGNQRVDLTKRLRVVYGLAELESRDGQGNRLHIPKRQRDLNWVKVLSD